jgi:hypothetical protein
MLKNTLILPVDDPVLAQRLLEEAIDDLDLVLMLIFGKGEAIERIVGWADKLCNKGSFGTGLSFRRALWIRDPDAPAVHEALERVALENPPVVAVLNFHDKVRARLESADGVSPTILEQAFLRGFEP